MESFQNWLQHGLPKFKASTVMIPSDNQKKNIPKQPDEEHLERPLLNRQAPKLRILHKSDFVYPNSEKTESRLSDTKLLGTDFSQGILPL